MKISEKLAELKQQEGKLFRLHQKRTAIVEERFNQRVLSDKLTQEEIDARELKSLETKKEKLAIVNKSITKLTQELVDSKTYINKRNVELGLDRDLAEMKFLRLELAGLMKLSKSGYLGIQSASLDQIEELGIQDRITELESRKAKLDSKIQSTNWSEDL